MPHVRTKALVLRHTEFSETSLVLALLTPDLGLVSALAKGARRPKSPFLGTLDLYSLNDVVLLARPGSSAMPILTEALTLDLFPGLRTSLPRAYAAHALAELLLGLVHEPEPSPELFSLTLGSLDALQTAEPDYVPVLVALFQLGLLKRLGYELVLTRCAHCQGPLPPHPQFVPVSVLAGGTICPDCTPSTHDVLRVSPGTLKVLSNLAAGTSNRVAKLRLTGKIRLEVSLVLTRVLAHLLGRAPRMTQYL